MMSDVNREANTASDTGKDKKDVSLLEFAKIIARYVILGVMIFLCVVAYVGRFAVVDGRSMEPSLHNFDVVIVSRSVKDLERGDVIVYTMQNRDSAQEGDNMQRIKRVIGLPGDVVEVDENTSTVCVNGEPLEEDYIIEGRSRTSDMTGPVTVPEGYCFVLGDNRPHSVDSRHDQNGLVSFDEIDGKILFHFLSWQ